MAVEGTETPIYHIPYPIETNDMDIPDDMGKMALAIEQAIATTVADKIVKGATLVTDETTNSASVDNNGILNLRLVPPSIGHKVNRSGDSMSGALELFAGSTAPIPTADSHIATKAYVDYLMPVGTIVFFCWKLSS